ncbi:MAG: tetratricopeptide repeat protein [Saprospiraceae bacterium]
MKKNNKIKPLQGVHDTLRVRNFSEATRLAEQVCIQYSARSHPGIHFQSLLFLTRIYNLKGKYQNDKSIYGFALDFLAEANKIIHLVPEMEWDFLFEKGKILLQQESWEKAEKIIEQVLKQANSPKQEVCSLILKSDFFYYKNNFDKAIALIGQARLIFEEEEELHEEIELKILSQETRINLRKHDYGEILSLGEEVLKLSRKYGEKENEFLGLNAIAVYYGARQDFKMAMLHFRKALDKSKEIGYHHGSANCLINIGTIYANLFNYDDALDRYITILKEYKDVLGDNTELIILNNIGNIYYTQSKLDKALEYFERSMSMASHINYKGMVAHTMAQISRTLVAKKEYEKALEYACKSEEMLKGTDYAEGKQINYVTLGNIYYKLKNYDTALKYVGKGIVSAKQLKDTVTEMRGYKLMSNILKDMKMFEKALEYQLVYAQAQEQYAMDQRNRQIIDLEIRYEVEKKEKEIEILTQFQDTLISQSKQIADQNEKLVQANSDLKQFAYVVSHDLKEPLRMIGSYSQLITRRYRDDFDDEGIEFLGYVTDGVARMNVLLNDLLEYATIGNNEALDGDSVDLNEIMDNTLLNLSIAMEEVGAKITSDKLPLVKSSHSLLSQLFQNLLSNAIKFRKPETAPEIHVGYEKIEKEHRISFIDNGIGIPADAQERIFVIFQRLHKRNSYEGTGIGLAICMRIVQKLGGSISVESEYGAGATFTIGLPIR